MRTEYVLSSFLKTTPEPASPQPSIITVISLAVLYTCSDESKLILGRFSHPPTNSPRANTVETLRNIISFSPGLIILNLIESKKLYMLSRPTINMSEALGQGFPGNRAIIFPNASPLQATIAFR